MPRRFSRRLVIDASVARSADDQNAIYPLSKHCRDCLRAVFDHGHRAVMTGTISAEWDRHQSVFARRWRVAMEQHRRIVHTTDDIDEHLQDRVENTAETERQRTAIIKDFHLVMAALATDRRIVSLDENIRQLLCRACKDVRELRRIVWANPGIENERVIQWLNEGARSDAARCLRSEEEA